MEQKKYYDVKMSVEERTNKKGDLYKILNLYFEDYETGELIPFHEIYLKDNLAQIIEFISKKIAKEKE